MGWPFGFRFALGKGFFDDALPVVFEQPVKKIEGGQGIAGCTVTFFEFDVQRATKFAQAIGDLSGKDLLTQPYRTEPFSLQVKSVSLQGRVDERMVELYVVCNKDFSIQQLIHLFGQLRKARRTRYHSIGDAGEPLYERWDGHFRIHQRFPSIEELLAVCDQDADLGDHALPGVGAGGFNIDDGVHGSANFVKKQPCLRKG